MSEAILICGPHHGAIVEVNDDQTTYEAIGSKLGQFAELDGEQCVATLAFTMTVYHRSTLNDEAGRPIFLLEGTNVVLEFEKDDGTLNRVDLTSRVHVEQPGPG